MIDMIIFILILMLTALFIYIITPILYKSVNNTDIERIRIICNIVVSFIEQNFPTKDHHIKKELAVENAKKIFQYLNMDIDEDIIHIFIESEIYRLKRKLFL